MYNKNILIIKTCIFQLVLAAVGLSSAAPEADPAFAYSVGAPLVYTHAVHHAAPVYAAVHHPLVYTAAAGCRNVAGALVPCAQGVLPYLALPAVAAPAEEAAAAEEPAVVEARKKREADADPAILASSTVVKNPAPVVYAAPHYGAYGLYGYPYTAYHAGYPYLYGRKKREAEADATADAKADPWLVYGYPYAYNHAYLHPYAYPVAAGCRNYLGGLVPCAGRR